MREDIIRIAREAGLIRAGENYTEPARWGISEITDFYQRAVAAEREACAKVCEETTASWTQDLYNSGCMDCAAAIRARGEQ